MPATMAQSKTAYEEGNVQMCICIMSDKKGRTPQILSLYMYCIELQILYICRLLCICRMRLSPMFTQLCDVEE